MAYVTSNYREVYAALRRLDPEAAKQLQKEMRTVANRVVIQAKGNASWSVKIPPSIRASSTAKGAAVRVQSSNRLAVLNELGKTWRHPLFGNHDWFYPQNARPFVKPAVDAQRAGIAQQAGEAIRRAIRSAGF